jgi:hypothetical protein
VKGSSLLLWSCCDCRVDGEEDKPRWSQNYRDRAAERRTGTAAQLQEDEKILLNLDYEQSKFLGGDFAHTHLVKGLDFALLKKIRSEVPSLEQSGPPEAGSSASEQGAIVTPHAEATRKYSTTRGAAIVAAMQALAAAGAVRCRENLTQMELTRALQGKPINGNEDFLPGRWVFEVLLDPLLEADGIPTCIRRTRDDAPAYEPLLIDPGLPQHLKEKIGSLSIGRISRALDRYESARQFDSISHIFSKASVTAVQADLPPVAVNDDNEDIFFGMGKYNGSSLPQTGATDANVLAQFTAIPDSVGGFVAGAYQLEETPATAQVLVDGADVVPTTTAAHAAKPETHSKMLEIIDDDEDDGVAIHRSRTAWASLPKDFEGEAFDSAVGAGRTSTSSGTPSDAISFAGLRVANTVKQGPVAGQKRGRKDVTAVAADVPAAGARFASLGGDIVAQAGSKSEAKTSTKNSATSLESYEQRIAKGGSWLAGMHKEEDGHKDRAKKRNKMDAQLQQIQALMAERRAGTVKGAIAGFGAGGPK